MNLRDCLPTKDRSATLNERPMTTRASKSLGAIFLAGALVAGAATSVGAQGRRIPVPAPPRPQEPPPTALVCPGGAVNLTIKEAKVPLRITVSAVPEPGSRASSSTLTVAPTDIPYTKELSQLVSLTETNARTGEVGRVFPASRLRIVLDSNVQDRTADVRGSIDCIMTQVDIRSEPGHSIHRTYAIEIYKPRSP